MMKILQISFLTLVLGLVGAPEVVAQQWQDAYPGVRYLAQSLPGPVQVRAVEVDLCAPGVELRATRGDEVWRRTSTFGQQVGAQVAINGDFYEWPPNALGLAIGDGDYWSPDRPDWGFVAFGESRAEITHPGVHVPTPPDWIEDAVGGNVMVRTEGVTTNDESPFCGPRHPRTAVGLSADGTKLYLAVADGRNPGTSIGMSCIELGNFMAYLGAHEALNLDGGGSTTMWREGMGVVNTPSDANGERSVANHLAVYATGNGPARSCPHQDWDVTIDSNFLELPTLNTDGSGADFPDALVGDILQGEVIITNHSEQVIRDVWAGYWLEAPFLRGLQTRIYSDFPAGDQQSWVLNDANDAPENPGLGQVGDQGYLNLYAFSPGESKRIIFDIEAHQFSLGLADHPDLRSWIKSIENIYGVQEGFWEDPPLNRVGENLRTFSELDILARDHWHFAAPEEDQLEGWRRCDGGAAGLRVDRANQALVVTDEEGPLEPQCLQSPPWAEVDADTYDLLVIEVVGESPSPDWSLRWRGQDGSLGNQGFQLARESASSTLLFPLTGSPSWQGRVDELQITVGDEATEQALMVGAIYFQSSTGEVSTPLREMTDVVPAIAREQRDEESTEDAGLGIDEAEESTDESADESADESNYIAMSTSSCAATGDGSRPPLWFWWSMALWALFGAWRRRHRRCGLAARVPVIFP